MVVRQPTIEIRDFMIFSLPLLNIACILYTFRENVVYFSFTDDEVLS